MKKQYLAPTLMECEVILSNVLMLSEVPSLKREDEDAPVNAPLRKLYV